MDKLRKHDSLVEIIKKELTDRKFVHLFDHIEYKRHLCGEIDIYAEKDDYILLFEVKCNNSGQNYKRAKEQMNRAEKYYFGTSKRIFKFFAYYDNNKPVIMWLKHY